MSPSGDDRAQLSQRLILRGLRADEFLRRILVEFRENLLDRLLQLGVATFSDYFGIVLDLDIGRDAVVFGNQRLSCRIPNTERRRGDNAAIQSKAASRTRPAPGSLADEFAKSGASEIPRQRVTAGTGEFIYQHYLRYEDRALGLQFIVAVTGGYAGHQLAREDLDDVGSLYA